MKRYSPEIEKVLALHEKPANGADEPPSNEARPLRWLDMSNWDNEPVPQRNWAIRDRVPANQVGLFSGEGGTGKSIIELMKNVAHVTGKDWFGSMPETGPAIYFGAEDDENEVHIRLGEIAEHYGVTFKDLIDGGLHILCLLGQEGGEDADATLCAPDRNGRIIATDLYRRLYEAAGDIKPKNISIDTLSHAFAGSEIDRRQVYQFAMHMRRLARVTNGGSVTVLSHPSLSGIASGSGISGSTAWHGAFRFRQYLTGVKAEDGEDVDSDLRELQFKKNQYGPLGEKIVLRYQRGLFLPEYAVTDLEKVARSAKAEREFLVLLELFRQQGRNVSHKATSSKSYAPKLFAIATKEGVRKAEFEAAMELLFNTGKIKVEQYGRPSQPCERIVAV